MGFATPPSMTVTHELEMNCRGQQAMWSRVGKGQRLAGLSDVLVEERRGTVSCEGGAEGPFPPACPDRPGSSTS
jgi:hypothetical protein